jgi:hypothetical protein
MTVQDDLAQCRYQHEQRGFEENRLVCAFPDSQVFRYARIEAEFRLYQICLRNSVAVRNLIPHLVDVSRHASDRIDWASARPVFGEDARVRPEQTAKAGCKKSLILGCKQRVQPDHPEKGPGFQMMNGRLKPYFEVLKWIATLD